MKRFYALFLASLISLVAITMLYVDKIKDADTTYEEFETSVRFIQPLHDSNIGTWTRSSGGTWALMGWSMMFGGDITLVGYNTMPAYIESSFTSSPKYSQTFYVATETGNKRILKGSKYVLWSSGNYQYMNTQVLVNPANFDQNNLIQGRSLIDNMLLESTGTDRSNMEDSLARGGTAWFNGLISAATSGLSHSTVYSNALWNKGSNAYSVPSRMYPTDDVTTKVQYSSFTEDVINSLFDISFPMPPIIEVDRTPPYHVSTTFANTYNPSGTLHWVKGGEDAKITIRQRDAGTGNYVQYFRLVEDGAIKARSYHLFGGTTTNIGTADASAALSIHSATRTENTSYGRVEWLVRGSTHLATYSMERYFRDNQNNNSGYQVFGTLRVDSNTPTHQGQSVGGYNASPTEFWIKANEPTTVSLSQYDSSSGNKYQYLRFLDGATEVVKSRHNFDNASTDNMVQLTSSHLAITNANRTANTNYGDVNWTIVGKTHGKSLTMERYYEDNVGNNNWYTGMGTVRIDGVAPTISANITNQTWTTNNITVNMTVADPDSGLQSKQYQWSTSSATPISGWNSFTSSATTATEGSRYLHYRVEDRVGNVRTGLFGPYQIDRTLPIGSFSPGSQTWTNSNITTSFNPYDSYSGVDYWRYRISTDNGATFGAWGSYIFGDTTQNITLSAEGHNVIEVMVVDNAGNSNIIKSGTYSIERTLPSGAFSPNSQTWTNGNVTTSFNPSDAGGSGVNYWRYRVSTNNGTTYGAWSSNVNGDVSQNILMSNEGINKIEAIVYDNAGNSRIITSGTYSIDKTSPSGIFTPNSQTWTNANITTSFNPSDAGGSGVSYWRYRVSVDNGATYGAWSTNVSGDTTQSVTMSTEGVNVIQAEIYDNAGNSSTVTSGTYSIDKTLPNGTFTPNSQTWTNTNVTTSFNPSDTGSSGVSHWQYRISTDNGVTYGAWSANVSGDTTQNITLSSQGINRIEAIVYDRAGNSRTITSGNYLIDKTLPNGTFTPNSQTWTNGNATTSFNPSDTGGSGVSYWQYRISTDNGVTYGAWSSNISGDTTQNIVLTGQGANKIEAVVHDVAGNSRVITSGTYLIDKTLPNGAFTPNSQTWTNADVTTSFNPSDTGGSGVSHWQYRISTDNGATYGTWSSSIAGDTTQSITISTQGVNVVQAIVYDVAGNTRTITSGTFLIDKTLPNGAFTPNSQGWTNTNINTAFNPSDTGGSTVNYWRYRISNDDGLTYGAWSSNIIGDTTQTITMSSEGLNKVQAVVYDVAGNSRTITSGTYQIDKSIPTGIFIPNSQTWTNKDVVTTFDPSDTGGSGIDMWRYRISLDNGATYQAWSPYVNGDTKKSIVLTTQALNRVQVEVFDVAGSKNTLTSGTFYIDKTKPSGVLTPNSASWTNANVTTAFNPSDTGGSNVAQWRYRTSADNGETYGAWSAYTVGDTTGTIVISNEGENQAQIEVTDVAGNSEIINSGTYQIDKTLPVGSFSPNSSEWKPQMITTFTPSDSGGSELSQWRYRISTNNGATYGSYINATGVEPQKITLTGNGLNIIQAVAYDNAGNQRTITSGVYKIDNIKPTTPIITAPDSSMKEATFTITPGTDVQYSGVAITEYRLSGANTSEWETYKSAVTLSRGGITTIEARTIDVAGNISDVASKQIEITTPVSQGSISILPAPIDGWSNAPIEVTVSHSDISNYSKNVTKTYAITTTPEFPSNLPNTVPADGKITIGTDGLNYVHAKYVFDDGKTMVKTEGPYKIDKSTYVNGFTMDLKDSLGNEVSTWTNKDLRLHMEVQSPPGNSGMTIQYKVLGTDTNWKTYINGGVPITAEGEYNILGRIINSAGSISEEQYVTAKIDKTKPALTNVSLVEVVDSSGASKFLASGEAKDFESGLNFTELNNGDRLVQKTGSDTYAKGNLSTRPLTARAFDKAGNMTEITFLDIPSIVFKDGYTLDQTVVRGDVNAVLDGSGELSYFLNNTAYECDTAPCDINITENAELTAVNKSGSQTAKKIVVIDNIDKSPTRLIFDGSRNEANHELVDFDWNRSISNATITCEYAQGVETLNPGVGTSYTFTAAQNYTYTCTLTGDFEGQTLTSNTITIEPDYRVETPSESAMTTPRIMIPNDVYVEESRIGTFYYINMQKSNYDESLPLPDALFQ